MKKSGESENRGGRAVLVEYQVQYIHGLEPILSRETAEISCFTLLKEYNNLLYL